MSKPMLIVFLGVMAMLLGAALAVVVAPSLSPALASRLVCAPGSTLRLREYDATWARPGETPITIECVDAQGQAVSSGRKFVGGFALLAAIYWLPCYAVLLLLAWAVSSWDRRRRARWARAAASIDWEQFLRR